MADDQYTEPGTGGGPLRYVVLAVAGIYIIVSLVLLFNMRGRIMSLEQKQAAASAAQDQLSKHFSETVASLKSTDEALASKVGLTEEELAKRTAELRSAQRAAESRLAAQQKQQIGEVSGQISGVKTEVGVVKTDVATTKTDLEATKTKLERVIGDLGQQSGLIARTRDELEYLKHKGDRNYFEFTLTKGKQSTPVSTISLQLKKADAKKGKFTLNVMADDRTIEKKDRTMFEPLQFYTGRDRMLYEVVVFNVEKDKISGYLATPKSIAAAAK